MITAKFGGSSLSDSAHFRLVKDIVRADPARRFIVPSAPGKRYAEDEKITDLLLKCHSLILRGQPAEDVYAQIAARFISIRDNLGLSTPVERELKEIYMRLEDGASMAYAASRGEYLCARLLADWLDYPFVDAADAIRFHHNGEPDLNLSQGQLRHALSSLDAAVIPGYYGADTEGAVHTFTRGGSDISGAMVAAAMNADLYENWTDVTGIRAADPKVVKDASFIMELSYQEMRELSYMGAAVIHEDAVFPVRQAGIPTRIRNTQDPLHPGTLIHDGPRLPGHSPVVTGIAAKKGFTLVSLEKDRMNAEIGFGRRVLQVFEDQGVSFEHLPTGIDTLCVIVSTQLFARRRDVILSGIREAVAPDALTVSDHLAMVATVGAGMVRQFGTAARLFTAVAQQGISIRTLSQAPNELSIIIGIDEKDADAAVAAIYDAFIRT